MDELLNGAMQQGFLTEKGMHWLLDRLKSTQPLPSETINRNVQGGKVSYRTQLLVQLRLAALMDASYRGGEAGQAIEATVVPSDTVAEPWISFPPADKLGVEVVRDVIGHGYSVFGKTMTRLNEALLAANLISNQTHLLLRKNISERRIKSETEILAVAATRSVVEDNFTKLKNEERYLVERLVSRDLLDEEAIQVSQRLENELVDFYQLLSLGDKAITFKVKDLEGDPDLAYRQIFERLRELAPNLNLNNLQVKVSAMDIGSAFETLIEVIDISFTVAESKYFSKITVPVHWRGTNASKFYPNPSFVFGVNRYLADQGSPERLAYLAPGALSGEPAVEEFAVRLLSKSAYDELTAASDAIELAGTGNYNNEVSPRNIQSFLADMDSIGLFSHLSGEEKTAATDRWRLEEPYSKESTLFAFPRLLARHNFRAPIDSGPREFFLQQLAEVSKGAFAPTDIVDIKIEATPSIDPVDEFGFTFNGSRYGNGRLDESTATGSQIVRLANQALATVGRARFYPLLRGWIYLKPEQLAYMQRKYPKMIWMTEN